MNIHSKVSYVGSDGLTHRWGSGVVSMHAKVLQPIFDGSII